jgi:hypothetical protein
MFSRQIKEFPALPRRACASSSSHKGRVPRGIYPWGPVMAIRFQLEPKRPMPYPLGSATSATTVPSVALHVPRGLEVA